MRRTRSDSSWTDGGRARALGHRLETAIDKGLAESDQTGKRRLQLVRQVGEEVALDLARALHRLRHSIESRPKHPDLVLPADAHAPGVIARCHVLRRGGELGQRAGERAPDQKDKQHRHQ